MLAISIAGASDSGKPQLSPSCALAVDVGIPHTCRKNQYDHEEFVHLSPPKKINNRWLHPSCPALLSRRVRRLGPMVPMLDPFDSTLSGAHGTALTRQPKLCAPSDNGTQRCVGSYAAALDRVVGSSNGQLCDVAQTPPSNKRRGAGFPLNASIQSSGSRGQGILRESVPGIL